MPYNTNIRNLKGEGGSAILAVGTTIGGGPFKTFDALTALADAVVTVVDPNLVGNPSGIPIPKGTTIYGTFTSVTVTSGSVIAYNKV